MHFLPPVIKDISTKSDRHAPLYPCHAEETAGGGRVGRADTWKTAGKCRDTNKNCELFNLPMMVAQMVKMAVCG